jgi:hypothetical protein
VSAVPVKDGVELRAINDRATALDLTVSAVAVAMDGTTRDLASATIPMAPDNEPINKPNPVPT